MEPTDRFLIVNADDFGRSETVNAGVVEAFRRGILTSTSIVATGTAFEPAVVLARQNQGLGIGIHLVVDRRHEPALPPSEIPSLVTSNGKFRARRKQVRTRDDVFREWDAQISKVLAAGIQLEHIDGHGHRHAHPRVAGVVIALAERYDIGHVRLPVEAIMWRPEARAGFGVPIRK